MSHCIEKRWPFPARHPSRFRRPCTSPPLRAGTADLHEIRTLRRARSIFSSTLIRHLSLSPHLSRRIGLHLRSQAAFPSIPFGGRFPCSRLISCGIANMRRPTKRSICEWCSLGGWSEFEDKADGANYWCVVDFINSSLF